MTTIHLNIGKHSFRGGAIANNVVLTNPNFNLNQTLTLTPNTVE